MTGRSFKTVLSALLALAAGLALRLWFVAHAGRIEGDTLIYGSIARNLLQHGVYGFTQTSHGIAPTLIRLPGYPLFLAACFAVFGPDRYTAVLCLQAIFDLLTCLLAAALARRLFGTRSGLAALWLGALCPFTAAYVAVPLTETLTLTTIALAFYSLHRWQTGGLGYNRWLWVTAASMACSVLLRPEQGLLPAAVLSAMLYLALRSARPQETPLRMPQAATTGLSHHRLSMARTTAQATLPVVLAALCVVLPLVPWTLRNWHTFHVVQPLAPRYATDPGEDIPLGFQRWYRTWAIDYASTEQVYWNYDSAEIDIRDLPARAFDSPSQYTRTADLLAEYDQTFNATPQFDTRFSALARERIHAHPMRYFVVLPVGRLLNMFLRPRTETLPVPLDWWKESEHPRATLFALAYATLNLAYLVLGAAGLWLWLRGWIRGWIQGGAWGSPTEQGKRLGRGDNHPLAWSMLAFLLLRCVLLLTLDNSEPRYTIEFFPLLLVWSSSVWSSSLFRPSRNLAVRNKLQKHGVPGTRRSSVVSPPHPPRKRPH